MKKTFLVVEYTRVESSDIGSFFSFKKDWVVGALAKNPSWVAEWRLQLRTPIWQYSDLQDIDSEGYGGFSVFFRSILSEPRVAYLLERRFKDDVLSSVFNSVEFVERICFGAYSVLRQVGAERVIFHTPPHHLHDYLFSKVAELLGLEVFVVKVSPLPWRAWLCAGIDEQRVIEFSEGLSVSVSDTAKKYLESLCGSYDKAIPEYERQLASQVKGRSLSIKADVRDFFKMLFSRRPLNSVFRLLALLEKRKLYKKYVEISNGFKIPERFFVFFLHFQPERTSVPEGLSYSAQWLAIKEISKALPSGVTLVVKEHPAMFRRKLDPRTRSSGFYSSIQRLSNVVAAPLDFDTFTLVDSSRAVITLTGTVGFEALIRKKPVIAFGVAPYKDCPGVYNPKCYEELFEIVRSFGDNYSSGECFDDYLLWVESNSIQASTLPDGKYISFFNVVSERECVNEVFKWSFHAA